MDYRLTLCARDLTGTVGSAGGWIVDHTLAGWRLTACVPDGAEARALRILGAEVITCTDSSPEPHAAVVLPAPDQHCEPVHHRISHAGRAFKAKALAAAGLSCGVGGHEAFWLLQPSVRHLSLATPAPFPVAAGIR